MSLFLLGAGFNADAAREAGPVYGNSIHVGRYEMDCSYPLASEIGGLCFGSVSIPAGKSIEGLFLDALEQHNYKPLQILSERLMEADFHLATRLSSSEGTNCYRGFFEAFAGSSILTFNYDSLPEIFLHRSKCWFPHDGYGVPVQAVPSFGPTAVTDRKSTSLVLHLHGSFCVYTSEHEISHDPGETISWLRPRKTPLYSFDPDSISVWFSSYQRAVSETGYIGVEERVIAPIPEKAQELKQPFIQETYAKAASLARQCERLVAVGYSFNPYDGGSYAPILHALAESKDRRLVIVSPDASNLAERIKHEQPLLHIEPIDKTLKTWATDSFRD